MASRLFGVWLHAKRGQTQVHRCLCYSRCSMRGSLHDRGGRAGAASPLAGGQSEACGRESRGADGSRWAVEAHGSAGRVAAGLCACSDMEGVCCKIGPPPPAAGLLCAGQSNLPNGPGTIHPTRHRHEREQDGSAVVRMALLPVFVNGCARLCSVSALWSCRMRKCLPSLRPQCESASPLPPCAAHHTRRQPA